MFITATLLFAEAGDNGMRGILLILVLIAVVLLLAGGVIALLTYFHQRKTQVVGTDRMGE